ncbi:DUF4198 domain-containing protein [Nitrincola tapanii]|uniref:DUF4198 domain-containing protein n=1 Tax=Nitrincola tapanii TaxID=1708751 RepID=A0A5A9W4B4_9GAMM|nr:DUF4198 domain-containing protein [Nitrincola tapanii]KAA0875353.1 DUF4198 domain-containing protein [Nitrincola tapanii]
MKKIKMLALASGLSLSLLGVQVSAHPMWMLPSEFNVSTEEGHWVTVDATASHGVFGFDKAIPVDQVAIFRPGGERQRMGSYFKGQRRSVFDFELTEQGTYKVELAMSPRYMTSYNIGGRDTQRRVMGNKVEVASQIPKEAREIQTTMMQNIAAFYVTQKAPTREVLELKGQGFELDAITHPSDLVVGEEAELRFLFNGAPVVGLHAEWVPGGTAFRSSRLQQDLTTDKDGRIRFTPEHSGPHLLSINMRQEGDGVLADQVAVNYLLSVEVAPQ